MDNYTLIDLIHTSLYLFAWIILSIGQGFVIGYVSNVLNFRLLRTFRQLGLAAILSLSVTPSLYYLVGLIGGIKLAVILNFTFLVIAAVIIILNRHIFKWRLRHFWRELSMHRPMILCQMIWIIIGFILLLDIQINKNVYLSMTAFDHAGKVAIADAIGRSGIPPCNPMFFPGHRVSLFYCYYWPLLCTIISTACGSVYNTREAVIAGVLWTGSVFLVTISLCCRYFKTINSSSIQIAPVALVLLLVSNLYVIIALPLNLLTSMYLHVTVSPNICWWTADQMSSFIPQMLWVPHHIAGLIAGVFASILILQTNEKTDFKQRLWLIVLAGFCLASNFGLSSYTAIAFGVTWFAWLLIAVWQKRFVDCVNVILSGTIGLLVAAPFLIELAHARHTSVPLSLGVRKFELLDWLIPALSHSPKFVHQLFYLLVLPLNYLTGFGFILLGAILFWQYKKNKLTPTRQRHQVFLVSMTYTGLILGTFVRSTVHNNDFGWRVMLLPTLAFLLWSAQLLVLQNQDKTKMKLPASNFILITIGFLTLIYSLYLDRTSPFFSIQTPSGARSYAWRKIYEDLNLKVSPRAIVQHNPVFDFFVAEPYSLYYSHHQAVASDDTHGPLMGPGRQEYKTVADEIKKLFTDLPAGEAIDICRRYKINVIVVKDTDAIWSNKSSWIWKYPVIAKNSLTCAFQVKQEINAE